MVNHRKYSKKRNRRTSRKMRGGFDIPSDIDFETLIPPGTPQRNTFSDISFNMSEESLGPGLDIDNLNVTANSNEGNTTIESQNSLNLNDSMSTINTNSDDSFVGNLDDSETELDLNTTTGGKRKSRKSRKSKKSRKTKKSRKSRKTRRHYRGGNGFTTQVDTILANDEQEYKEYEKLMSKQ